MKRLFSIISILIAGLEAGFAGEKDLREANEYYRRSLEDLLLVETPAKAMIGSRGGDRDALSAEVPIDVITAAQLQSTGQSELMRALAVLVPGFNFPRPSITDGTDHAPPFTLRGLNPDQVLVLVNGKRLHQSSLLHNNGTIGRGSSSVDLNAIPLRAIERIEVLRDGAAAQYGSDAIAGIINIILKGYGHANHASLSYGRTHKGDGVLRQADVFYSRALPGDGFFNFTVELRDRGPTNRAGPDILDGGRINTHFGDADTQDLLLAVHAELPRSDATFYLHGVYDRRRSSAGAFFRRANDDRNISAIYPDGFLPSIEPKILDYSMTIGSKGVLENGTHWDLSYTQGHNDYHFYVSNSLNTSLGLATPTSFDSGATRYTQRILNLDLSQRLGRHTFAGGYEFREERYRIVAGEPASYVLGPAHDGAYGAQGFPGFTPDNAVMAKRQAHALYGDIKYGLTERLMIDAAVRAEHFSDFGSTANGKLALRLRAHEDLLLRASASTGFRAPSLSQSHFSYTGTYRNSANDPPLYWGNFAVDHPVARALGATDLKPEKSRHLTLGLVYQPTSTLSASADWFLTDIADRILPTGYIASWNLSTLSPQAVAILDAHRIDGAVYFTNAVNTRTQGLDLRLDSTHEFGQGARLKLTGAYHFSKTRITGVNAAPGVLGVAMTELVLDAFTRTMIEESQPRSAFKLWSKYSTPAWDLVLNLNRFGSFASVKGDETVRFRAKWTLDAEYSYRLSKDVTLSLGGVNLFNAMPDEWGQTSDTLVGSGKVIRYSQYAPFGYNGAFYYLRLGLTF
ncbi:MAG: TonB-dependent receptor [Rhodocyclaceae bacterium]|nr:TonB-dependent receptor [Rhodocyclaceae bacterium]